MLACDAFGVLPPIARLTPEQATYHFLSGYTAKVAGTERGLGKEPQVTFSTCFGAPFLPMPPAVYAHLFREKVTRRQPTCWLVNTGWTRGPFGVGHRIEIAYSRALLRAAMSGELDQVETYHDPFFGLTVPSRCPGVPDDILFPEKVWADRASYEKAALELAGRFRENFSHYEGTVDQAILAAGPK